MTSLFVAFEDRVLRVQGAAEAGESEIVIEGEGIESITANPKAPEHLIVGTTESGIWRSVDSGTTWNRVGEHTVTDPVTAIATDPTEPTVFYAGTEPSKVYTTVDGGDTWTHLDGLTDLSSADSWAFPPRPSTHHVRWIEVDPNDPDHLYVAIEAGALVRSFDGGETWEDRVPSGRWDTHSMATHPAVPGHAWAAAGDGFAETDDWGATWTYPQDGLDHRYCWSVAVDPADPERVVMSAALGPGPAHTSSRAESYVYRRIGGPDATWQRAGDGLPDGTGMLRPVIRAGFDPGVAYLASNLGVWRTDSMGAEWTSIEIDWPDALSGQTVRDLEITP